MTYRDPQLLRQHVVKVRFSREEDRLLDALADYTGGQKATLVHDLVVDQVRALLAQQCGPTGLGVEGPCRGLASA